MTLDIFPYREDIVSAVDMSIRNVEALRQIALRIDPAVLKEKQSRGDAIESQEYIRDFIFGNAR